MEAKWYKNLEHGGIQISFPGKPAQEVINELKSNGFRWSRFSKVWYSKGHQYQIDLANKFATYEGEVGEKLTFAEKMDKKLGKADARAIRYETLAEKADERSNELIETAHKMGEMIPFGQPILVGHHSEKSDRNFRGRIQKKYEKGFEEMDKAKYFKQRAAAAGDFEERHFNLGTTLRKLDKLEAQVRSVLRRSDIHIQRADTDIKNIKRGLHTDRTELISRAWLEEDQKIIDKIQEEIDYWTAVVDKHKEEGKVVYGPADFKTGDRIITRFGKATVLKVNPKSLGVWFDQPNLNFGGERTKKLGFKTPYDDLPQNCKIEVEIKEANDGQVSSTLEERSSSDSCKTEQTRLPANC